VHVAHAEEGAQQILRADVGAHLASCDRALEQRADRLGQTLEGESM